MQWRLQDAQATAGVPAFAGPAIAQLAAARAEALAPAVTALAACTPAGIRLAAVRLEREAHDAPPADAKRLRAVAAFLATLCPERAP
jgi:hypothetical protein